jgi:hypothetical protein
MTGNGYSTMNGFKANIAHYLFILVTMFVNLDKICI